MAVINLSDLKNYIGNSTKVKIFCKILSSPSSAEFVVADQTDFTLLLVDENTATKHLQIGNSIKILNPEIFIKDGKEVIKIVGKTSIFPTSKMDGVVSPPKDNPLMNAVKKATPMETPKTETITDINNTIKIASTFGMDKCQVKILNFQICFSVKFLLNFFQFRLSKVVLLVKLLNFKGSEKFFTKTKKLEKL